MDSKNIGKQKSIYCPKFVNIFDCEDDQYFDKAVQKFRVNQSNFTHFVNKDVLKGNSETNDESQQISNDRDIENFTVNKNISGKKSISNINKNYISINQEHSHENSNMDSWIYR